MKSIFLTTMQKQNLHTVIRIDIGTVNIESVVIFTKLFSLSMIFSLQLVKWQRKIKCQVSCGKGDASVFKSILNSFIKKIFHCFCVLWQFIGFSRRKASSFVHQLRDVKIFYDKMSRFKMRPDLPLYEFFLNKIIVFVYFSIRWMSLWMYKLFLSSCSSQYFRHFYWYKKYYFVRNDEYSSKSFCSSSFQGQLQFFNRN